MAGLVLCLVAALLAYVVAGRPRHAGPHPAAAPATELVTGAASRAAAGAALLTTLTDRLQHGSRADVLALAAPHQPRSRRELGDLYANVHRIPLSHLSLRYVAEDAHNPARQAPAGAWVADVQVAWRVQGYDAATSHHAVTMTLARTPHGAAFVTARRPDGEPAPLWLLHRLRVLHGSRSLVMAARPEQAPGFARMAARAVSDVRRVLHHWHGPLVVEIPGTQGQLDRVLGQPRAAYSRIAAVTTTADGSRGPHAPTHVFVNPAVFARLGPRGSQIVLSHEATHVATHAATATMPTWLLEGFADYVALAHVHLPVSVTASQILGQVRRAGTPTHLPGVKELASSNRSLGASYEASWLACRLVAVAHGERALVQFYRQSARAGSTSAAFHTVLHTDQRAFTRAWRRYLDRLS